MRVVIPRRFCGPPDSGNGGYTCGLVAKFLDGASEVTLRKPIPIEREMVIEMAGEKALLKDGETLVAEGMRTNFEPVILPKISFATAEAAEEGSPAFQNHPFPTCFVCGPERQQGDGLRIFPGRVKLEGKEYFASGWVPAAEFADDNGNVKNEFIWAALDCPTGFAGGFPYEGKLVTGRLAVDIRGEVKAAEKCVLLSWQTGVEGRKHFASAVLLGEDGSQKALARATWIKLD
jgi:hypothetical protein